MDEWERLEEKLRQQPQFSEEMLTFVRRTVGSAKDCVVDRAGRTLVPPELRDFAGLHKDVVIIGALAKFDIWSLDRWNDYYQRSRAAFGSLATKLGL
jgi:MraZ protein